MGRRLTVEGEEKNDVKASFRANPIIRHGSYSALPGHMGIMILDSNAL